MCTIWLGVIACIYAELLNAQKNAYIDENQYYTNFSILVETNTATYDLV